MKQVGSQSKTASVTVGAFLLMGVALWGTWAAMNSTGGRRGNGSPGAAVVAAPDVPTRPPPVLPEVQTEVPPESVPLVEVPMELTKQTLEIEEAPADPLAYDVSDLPHVQREGNTARSYVPKEYFEEKYENATLEELLDAQARVNVINSRFMQEASAHYFEGGGGESEVTDWQDPATLDDAMSAQKAAPRKPSQGLIGTSRAEPHGDGSQVLKMRGDLPWADYVSVYDNQDELFWLLRELRRREQERETLAQTELMGSGK